jgi:hypothetical protein
VLLDALNDSSHDGQLYLNFFFVTWHLWTYSTINLFEPALVSDACRNVKMDLKPPRSHSTCLSGVGFVNFSGCVQFACG